MGRFKDLTGQKFNRLTVIQYLSKSKWQCKCDCGNIVEVQGGHLKNGHTKSCGCYNNECRSSRMIQQHFIHGKSNTKIYKVLKEIKYRCYSKNHRLYKYYGARGIVVCDEWKRDFEAFYNWAMDNGYKEGLTIDRIDANGNYEPSNCRWITNEEQQRNKRSNRYITCKGETKLLIDWCRELNLNYKQVWRRIYKHNWPVEQAFELEERHHE